MCERSWRFFQNFVYGNVVYAPEKVYRATLSCLFPLDVQNEIQLLSRLFCNSWLVCLLCFLLTNAPLVKVIGWKSDFGWHRFQNWAYSLALAWGVRELKSLKRFWNAWWPSEAASRLVSLSTYCLWCFFFSVSWSRAYGLCGLSLYTSNDLTYNSIRFKKPLDIFWPQIQRKGSEDYLVMILAVNRKLWAIFLPRVHLEKEPTPGSRLKT